MTVHRAVMVAESASLLQTYRRVPVVFVRGEGTHLYDTDGRQYLDFLGGLAVVGVGHANPRVAAGCALVIRECEIVTGDPARLRAGRPVSTR